MIHELSFRIALAALLGLVAAGGNLLGGYFVVYREWPRRYLQYFLALGAGYMLSVAIVEVIPESVHLAGEGALIYVLVGFFIVHLFEHTIAPHFHFGEETHTEEMQHGHAQSAIFLGLAIHTFLTGSPSPPASWFPPGWASLFSLRFFFTNFPKDSRLPPW